MLRVMAGLICLIAAGDVNNGTAQIVTLAAVGVALMFWGNRSIADRENRENDGI